jgi:hypothetical protein
MADSEGFKEKLNEFLAKLSAKKTAIIAILNVMLLVLLVGAVAYASLRIGQASTSTIKQTISSTIIYTSTYYTTSIGSSSTTIITTTTTIPQSSILESNSSLLGCPNCYGLFLYSVSEGDSLSSIAQNYGLSSALIAKYNNVTSVYPGEQILLPFYNDTIETDVKFVPKQNDYDFYLLEYAVEFHLNPMLIKAEVYDESSFNANAISSHDTAPGVCGTGHSYGLLQYTPACFVDISGYGMVQNFVPNADVLYGQNDGEAQINCLTNCSIGDYFVSEYSSVSSSTITSDLTELPKYSGWNNSVFNPNENIFAVMQIERTDIGAMMLRGYTGCTYAQYNEMALAQYQQSITWVINGCGSTYGGMTTYVGSVLNRYSELTQNSVHGWTDEYE